VWRDARDAKHVPSGLRDRYPAIPWRAMAGLRDVLVHDDFGVDLALVEQVVREEVPLLVLALEDLRDAEGWSRPEA
jgi:uncharacterized protein with HEPN domain